MKIVNLHVENVKRIKVFDLTVGNRDAVVIEGKNGQGKSSTLDSISYLLGGTALIPKRVIRTGADTAEISADLGDFIVSRKWKDESSSTLEIRTKDGAKIKAPQTFLDEKIKLATLDPLAFCRLTPAGRLEELQKIDGLNFAPLKKEYDELYNYRTLVKRDLDKTKKALEEYKDLKEPVGVRTVAEIRADLDRLETTNAETTAHNEKIKTLSRDFEDLKKENERKQGELADVIKTLEVLEAKKDKLKKELEGIMDVAAELKAKITASVEKSLIDSSVLKNELEAATNAAGTRAKLERKKELESEVEKESLIVAETNEKMAAVKEKKEAMLKAFNLPVPNLSIADDIYIDEIPFDNLSQAKKIELVKDNAGRHIAEMLQTFDASLDNRQRGFVCMHNINHRLHILGE